jgi:hypothetical protein
MVGLGRLERPTSPLSGVRSNHLSYRPETSMRKPRQSAILMTPDPRRIVRRRKRNEDGGVPHLGPDWPLLFQEFRYIVRQETRRSGAGVT